MNTQELKCFLRVAERMSFTRAAEELYRNSKSVYLTLEGKTFYQDAQEIMMKIEASFSHLNDIRNSKHTLLRIGCITAQEAASLSKPLSYLREQFPDVEPRIIISDFSQQLRMLKEDHLDLLLGTRNMAAHILGEQI